MNEKSLASRFSYKDSSSIGLVENNTTTNYLSEIFFAPITNSRETNIELRKQKHRRTAGGW